jgi:hypothetical protein
MKIQHQTVHNEDRAFHENDVTGRDQDWFAPQLEDLFADYFRRRWPTLYRLCGGFFITKGPYTSPFVQKQHHRTQLVNPELLTERFKKLNERRKLAGDQRRNLTEVYDPTVDAILANPDLDEDVKD